MANDTDDDPFIHPVIRSILLHFQMGYDHPFVDGNGRTARALFYWSMRRHGYWLTEFVSISSILTRAPAQYAESYLYTETDDNDATYFVIYQLRVLLRAIDRLHIYLASKEEELRRTQEQLQRSAVLRAALNHRQLAVVNHALKRPLFTYTIQSHRGSHNVAYETARSDLMRLAKLGLLEQGKVGRSFHFTAPKDLSERIHQMR
jgi:Fic family protein